MPAICGWTPCQWSWLHDPTNRRVALVSIEADIGLWPQNSIVVYVYRAGTQTLEAPMRKAAPVSRMELCFLRFFRCRNSSSVFPSFHGGKTILFFWRERHVVQADTTTSFESGEKKAFRLAYCGVCFCCAPRWKRQNDGSVQQRSENSQ